MKILKTKKLNIAICWNGLSNTPPKEFPTVGEMEKTGDILDGFKAVVPEFIKILKDGEELNLKLQTGKLTPEEMVAEKGKFQKESNIIEEKQGKEEVSIELEDDVFNTFFQQFERWGKNWFTKLEPFLAFRKDMVVANGQPKGK